jgi:uncharacterized protein YjbI with pentapeptide repeats
MKFEIKSFWSGKILFECEAGSLKLALEAAVSTGADLTGAYLKGAYLTGADLTGAYLKGADLKGADLEPIKYDLWAVLCCAPAEASGLRQALVEGRVNGSTYEGECACLVGTIANVKHCSYDQVPNLKPNSDRPIERFFMGIKTGDTPEKSQFSKFAVEWIDEWVKNLSQAFELKEIK